MLRLSTKQKREVYSLSSLLLHLIIFIVLLVALNSCSLLDRGDDAAPDTCTTFATVKDLRGLDGCGFVLVLDSGEKLQPVQIFRCGNEPLEQTNGNPRNQFDLKDGQRVKIGYKESKMPTICMVGSSIELTCITEVSPGTATPEPAL